MKATPLLRAWLKRLENLGVRFALRQRWTGWNAQGELCFQDRDGVLTTQRPDATLLALGGASWPHLGSDGAWVEILAGQGLPVEKLAPANCGFLAAWTPFFAGRFAGQPLKPVTATFGARSLQGEIMLTKDGLEGGPIYALSGAMREAIAREGEAVLTLDLRPGLTVKELEKRLRSPRGSQSLATFWRKAGGLSAPAIALLREGEQKGGPSLAESGPEKWATLIKAFPLKLVATASLERAISSAGGVRLEALDERFMLRQRPGTFLAGEMLDWDAPTGGYLLQACFSTGHAAAQGLLAFLSR